MAHHCTQNGYWLFSIFARVATRNGRYWRRHGTHFERYKAPLIKKGTLITRMISLPPIRKALHPEEAVIMAVTSLPSTTSLLDNCSNYTKLSVRPRRAVSMVA